MDYGVTGGYIGLGAESGLRPDGCFEGLHNAVRPAGYPKPSDWLSMSTDSEHSHRRLTAHLLLRSRVQVALAHRRARPPHDQEAGVLGFGFGATARNASD